MAQGGAPQDLEMGNIRTPERITSPTSGTNGHGFSAMDGVDPMTAFYTEVRECHPSKTALLLTVRVRSSRIFHP